MANIDWKQIQEWDKKYTLKALFAEDEYNPMFIEHTEGDYLVDKDGTKWLDFCNQLYCVNAGQNVPEIQEAIKEATKRYGFLWDEYATNYKAEAAKILIEDVINANTKTKWARKVRFTLGGGDSVEVAMMLARLVTGKSLVATRIYGYHGVSTGAVSCTRLNPSRNSEARADGSTKPLAGADYQGTYAVPAPFCYRCPLGHTYPECKCALPGGQLPCVKQTEDLIRSHGVDRTAAIITEPAMGAGTIMPPKEYLPQIFEMKNRLGILWICDEVLMGFGRLGKWFGHQYYSDEIYPDLMTTAKGLSSSSLPIGAVVIGDKIADYMAQIRWNHVSTFSGHPLAVAAAVANMKYLLKNDAPGKCAEAGEYFRAELLALQEKHKTIGLVAGAGMFWEVELVKNRETKEAFIPEDRFYQYQGTFPIPVGIVGGECAKKNVILTGFCPNTLRIGASCFVSKESMDKAIDALDGALDVLDSQC